VRLIFKNLNVLRSTITAISTSFEVKEIIDSAANNLPNLFPFSSFGVFWKEGPSLYLYQDESCPASFTQQVIKNMVRVLRTLGEELVDIEKIVPRVEKRKLTPQPMLTAPRAALKSHLTLPLAVDGEIIGCISVNSDQPSAFDAQDLQFFSVIGCQMAATLQHLRRFSSVKSMATYDALTGLYNRRYFEERLKVETQRSFSYRIPLSLIMVDIDHFKRVNDTLGHPEGDMILRKIASLLTASVRKNDVVARYGGEEFILILPEAGIEASSMIAERIRLSVESTLFDVGKAQSHVSVSLGISNFPDHQATSGGELIKMADQALYEAKRKGRNRVCVFGSNPGKT
jgi:diguanylate cyclase (GGDEF)-like protein